MLKARAVIARRALNPIFTTFHEYHCMCALHQSAGGVGVAWMSVAEQNISFDDVLDAVKESKRGRWFLDEYEGRLRKSDTAELRAAISKLESVMTSMSGSGADAALLARAKSAILAARKDIAALDDKPQGLSEEGRLFARLARRGASLVTGWPVELKSECQGISCCSLGICMQITVVFVIQLLPD